MLKKHPITGSIISLKVKSHMQEFIMQLTLTKMEMLMVWWLYLVKQVIIKALFMIAGD